jgi:hypothetical protein
MTLLPSILVWGAYRVHHKNNAEELKKAERIHKIEDRYMKENKETIVKL